MVFIEAPSGRDASEAGGCKPAEGVVQYCGLRPECHRHVWHVGKERADRSRVVDLRQRAVQADGSHRTAGVTASDGGIQSVQSRRLRPSGSNGDEPEFRRHHHRERSSSATVCRNTDILVVGILHGDWQSTRSGKVPQAASRNDPESGLPFRRRLATGPTKGGWNSSRRAKR